MRLAAAGIAKSQQVLASVHERTILEQFNLLADSQGQTLEVEVFQCLLHWKPGRLDQPDDLVGPANITLRLCQFVQILFVTESFLRGPDGISGVIFTEHRQVKFFEQFGEMFATMLHTARTSWCSSNAS